jgi:predicted enzyme related to lactoylglutathione lyase
MVPRSSYPAGVPCWVDLVQPDLDGLRAFYGGLFGWTFDVRTPPEAPAQYAYALLDGQTVAGVGTPGPGERTPGGWMSYVSVDSADAAVAAVEANGGTIVSPPTDAGPAGRWAHCADADGAVFGLWQPGELKGAQLVNFGGSWNFSDLAVAERSGAEAFYGAVFGWEYSPFGIPGEESGFFRVAGYGKFLADLDPDVAAWQETGQAPDGFSDAVAILQPGGAPAGAARWNVTFGVDDADASYAKAIQLGATATLPLFDTPYTRQGNVRDPQGAEITISEYRPPEQG